jgi:hypothetical protein
MTFMQWVAANKAFLITAALLVGGALYRALPAEASSFNFAQFILDWVRGILGALPSNAPKLTPVQKASLAK